MAGYNQLFASIFSALSKPINMLLDYLPDQWMRPTAIMLLSYVLAVAVSGKMEKFRWVRRIFLTAVFYLAFTAIGVA